MISAWQWLDFCFAASVKNLRGLRSPQGQSQSHGGTYQWLRYGGRTSHGCESWLCRVWLVADTRNMRERGWQILNGMRYESLLRLQPISLGFGGPKTFRMLVFCPVGSTWLHKQRCDGVTPCTFRMLLESSRDGLGYWGNAFTLEFYVASAIFHRHISSWFSMIFLYFLARKGQPHEFKCASLLDLNIRSISTLLPS